MGGVPSDIVSVSRGVALWTIRALSAGLVSYGLYLVGKKVLFGIGTGQFVKMYTDWDGIGEGHSFYRGLSMMGVGAAVGLASRRLAAWVFAVPSRGCPGCGYEETEPRRARCPECGLEREGGAI